MELQAEKKALSPLHVKRHLELASSIAGLTEEIEELRSEKKRILARAKCDDDEGMKTFTANLEQAKQNYNDLIKRKTALTAERQDGITQYEDAYERIQPGEEEAVKAEQQHIREASLDRLSSALIDACSDRFDPKLLIQAEKETDFNLSMDKQIEAHRRNLNQYNHPEHQNTKKHDAR